MAVDWVVYEWIDVRRQRLVAAGACSAGSEAIRAAAVALLALHVVRPAYAAVYLSQARPMCGYRNMDGEVYWRCVSAS